jgi:hypothetical protein
VIEPKSDDHLICVECRAIAPPEVPGWRAFLVGVHDELDDEETVAVYCPECAAREFGERWAALDRLDPAP